ncbi:MAG: methionyl-tRNA formyltransferase [Sulfuricaulis sp.]
MQPDDVPEQRVSAAGLRLILFTCETSPIIGPLVMSRHPVAGIIEYRTACDEKSLPYRLLRRIKRFILRQPYSLAYFCARNGIAHRVTDSGRDPALVDWMQALSPDLMVVYFTPLIDEAIFSIPRHGSINLHPSLLPLYRGKHPLFWSHLNMDEEIGVTVHFLARGADNGDILSQRRIPLVKGRREKEIELHAVRDVGVPLLLEAIEMIARGEIEARPQPRKSPTPPARRIQSHELRDMIDWERWPIERVWTLLRFAEDWPGLLPRAPGWRRRLPWSIAHYVKGKSEGVPGQIRYDEQGFYLHHPEGKIRLRTRFDVKKLVTSILR